MAFLDAHNIEIAQYLSKEVNEKNDPSEDAYYTYSAEIPIFLEVNSNESSPREPKVNLGIIKPKPREDAPYSKLCCEEKDRIAIGEIVKNMAEHGKIWLLKHRTFMNELGDSVRHVHPLKFLEVVFTDEYLKSCMRELFEDYFKKTGFMDGLGETLTNKAAIGDLDRYLADFCKAIKVPFESVKIYFEAKDWEGLVRFLMNN